MNALKDKVALAVARRLPARLVYWAVIHAVAVYSRANPTRVVPDTSAFDLVDHYWKLK
jgi:hypothetical protein